jgi:hypothetical protein
VKFLFDIYRTRIVQGIFSMLWTGFLIYSWKGYSVMDIGHCFVPMKPQVWLIPGKISFRIWMINMHVYMILSRWPKVYNNPTTYVIFRGRQWMWLQHRPPLDWYSFKATKELSYERSRVEVFKPSCGETKSDCCRGLLFDMAKHCMSQ